MVDSSFFVWYTFSILKQCFIRSNQFTYKGDFTMNSTITDSASPVSPTQRGFTVKELVLGGMFAGLMAIISQISLPMPNGMPITVQVFGATLIGVVLGWRLGLLATITYTMIGAVGMPVFANFRGGVGSLVGPTGGYIWSWPLMVVLCGIRPKTGSSSVNTALTLLFSLLGLAITEIIGGLQWAAMAGNMSVSAVFSYAIVAFIPKDIILTIIAVFVGIPMRKVISKTMQ